MSTIPSKQHHVKSDLLREVRKKDPEFDRDSRKVIAYRFSNGRTFTEITDDSGPYSTDE